MYCAWQVSGIIPDQDAPRPKRGSKAEKVLLRKEEMLYERRLRNLARDSKPLDYADAADDMRSATIDHNYSHHYDNVLELCTAIRIWASRTISPQEVLRAHHCLSNACQSWCRMGCHLTPNFHLSTHLIDFFLRLGPAYAWWTYPYERNNGFLGRFKNNGHTGGELEVTMMRGWVKAQLISDLVSLEMRHRTTSTRSK